MARELALDLGTSTCQVFVRGQGIVVDEPTIVALDARSREVLALGAAAIDMIGRTTRPVRAVLPLVEGAISDFEITERMIRFLLTRAGATRLARTKVLAAVPASATAVERRALQQAIRGAGAVGVHLIEQPMAAAIGLGLPTTEPVAVMICDLGGGKTEVAVMSLGGIVTQHSLRVGGDHLNAAIASWIRQRHKVVISEATAEAVKIAIGSVAPFAGEHDAEVHGRVMSTGEPTSIIISPDDVRAAIGEPVSQMIQTVLTCLSEAPPELSQDILFHGINLVGGTANLRGMPERIEAATSVPVHIAGDPQAAVVIGAGHCLDELDRYQRLFAAAVR